MSQKLVIVIAVQSMLVLGLGGVAVGMSVSRSHAPAPLAKKARPRPVVEPTDEHETAPAEEEAAPAPRKKPEVAHEPDEPKSAKPVVKPHEAPSDEAHSAKSHDEVAKPSHEAVITAAPPGGPKEPLEAFAWLDEGNGRWMQGFTKTRDIVAARSASASSFKPWAMVLTCSDGRASPEAVFDAAPGAFVSLRAVTLKVDDAVLKGTELAVRRFSPRVVVVLGHAGCEDGSGKDAAAQVTALTQKLFARKPIRERLQKNSLLVLRATYDLETGKVRWLDSEDAHDTTAAATPAAGH